ncbi:hypothetical protein PAPYR_3807 [Paratrimastix pyriformis]|uniref:Uncharacterized protein n=1 Tax=Paratrimastix pyriformis TaxID=342808 RepID=A0ABQ8URA8_9EUKA|nr:hypothetical protein PAPYR_3807 [Paratrimastix pyriformis]
MQQTAEESQYGIATQVESYLVMTKFSLDRLATVVIAAGYRMDPQTQLVWLRLRGQFQSLASQYDTYNTTFGQNITVIPTLPSVLPAATLDGLIARAALPPTQNKSAESLGLCIPTAAEPQHQLGSLECGKVTKSKCEPESQKEKSQPHFLCLAHSPHCQQGRSSPSSLVPESPR